MMFNWRDTRPVGFNRWCDVDRNHYSMNGLPLRLIAAISAYAAVVCAWAGDVSLSGFGTVGYARSNKPMTYDRFINNDGTLRRDSVAGIQLDASITNRFGATIQVKAAPASDNDAKYDATVAWAFLSYRPANDWLVRVGRQRMPLYLHSANFDVGVTYDFARLPTEMYSISPNNEIDGLSFSRNWAVKAGDWTLDGFWGTTHADVRTWSRDNVPAIQSPGASFRKLSVDGGGLSLSFKTTDDTYRVAYGSVTVGMRDGRSILATFPLVVTPFPGVSYFQVDNALPGPGLPTIDRIRISSFIVGADIYLGSGFRAIGEYARTIVPQTDLSIQSKRGYVSILRHVNHWTPYVTYAYLRSDSRPLSLNQSLNNSVVPGFVPGSEQINALQRVGADKVLAFDQSSVAIGSSYSISPTSKLKAEWMRVRIGQVSSLVDAPPGANIRNQKINVISLSYSMVF